MKGLNSMGTRGAYGFIVDEVEKVTYNHFDSYPSGLGKDILTFLSGKDLNLLKENAQKIQMVDERSVPTKEQIAVCKNFTDLGVSSQSENDWYCLLREAQGSLEPYMSGLSIMVDNKN